MEINKKKLETFVSKIQNFSSWETRKQTDYLIYYLTAEEGYDAATSSDLEKLFNLLDLNNYARLSAYLSENISKKFVKKDRGYRLNRKYFDVIDKEVKNEPEKIYVSEELQKMADAIADPTEKKFVYETLNCYKVQANRATIVMCWILAMYHLKKYIFEKKLVEFNAALQKNPERGMSKIVSFTDFDELKESKLIELARSAGVLSNDLRKILDEKLGIRNSAAHPSGIEVSQHKATEFLLDILKHVMGSF